MAQGQWLDMILITQKMLFTQKQIRRDNVQQLFFNQLQTKAKIIVDISGLLLQRFDIKQGLLQGTCLKLSFQMIMQNLNNKAVILGGQKLRERGNNTQNHVMQLEALELQTALNFLKRRFQEYTIEQILYSLTHHLHKLKPNAASLSEITSQQRRDQSYNQIIQRNRQRKAQASYTFQRTKSRVTSQMRDIRQQSENFPVEMSVETIQQKCQEIKLIAMLFRETGVKYSLVRNFFPAMTPQHYRDCLDTINHQIINEIQKFLRIGCKLKIEYLNNEQIRYLKSQLLKVKEWLGYKNISELQTYSKFILRKFQQKDVEICQEQTLRLYKRLVQFARNPFLDSLEALQIIDEKDQEEKSLQKPINCREASVLASHFTKNQQFQVIETFLKHNCTLKTSRDLCSKYKKRQKWAKSSIQSLLNYALKKSIKKIVKCKEKYLNNSTRFVFKNYKQVQKCFRISVTANKIKSKLLKFYLLNRITISGLTTIINYLNQFVFTSLKSIQQITEHEESLTSIPQIQVQTAQQRKQVLQILPQLAQKHEVQAKEMSQQHRIFEKLSDSEGKNDKWTYLACQQSQKVKKQVVPKGITWQFTQIIDID